jgi:hypothetical protein
MSCIDLRSRLVGETIFIEAGKDLYQLDVLDSATGYVAVTSNTPSVHDATRAYVKNSGGQPVLELGERFRLEFGNGVIGVPAITAMSVKGNAWNYDFN